MKLDAFYSLRTEFTVIGLTGRIGSGCSEVARLLANGNFPSVHPNPKVQSTLPEDVKYKICHAYINHEGNWSPYGIIVYKNVLLLHVLYTCVKDCSHEDAVMNIWKVMTQNGPSKPETQKWTNRFDEKDDFEFFNNQLISFFASYQGYLASLGDMFSVEHKNVNDFLKANIEKVYSIFFEGDFPNFADSFYNLLNGYSTIKRSRFTHDVANNLRATGLIDDSKIDTDLGLKNIYTIAHTINQLIKGWRREKQTTKLVIDSLKNSLELMYFKEKYAAFYMISTNKTDAERRKHINKTLESKLPDEIERKKVVDDLMKLDDNEYKLNDFKRGVFSSPDIENCIQKSDYHIFIDSGEEMPDKYLELNHQLLKLMALIGQPGIITPSTDEHFMQVAYNAKFNSGCISRQVGAVVTDGEYSIKAIGWNDVPENQMPCSSRSIKDLVEGAAGAEFTEFEKYGEYKDGNTFRKLAKQVVNEADLSQLNGRNCSFCFKSFHNAFEDDKNQVHTRSLHAEENAMLQITKFGGQGIKDGNLYTTASPCELCSKKAFQLGIKNIYYIDPYPGIAIAQILKAGLLNENNPKLIMFQGAVGRAFHKLYEPFMAYKDEIALITDMRPEPSVEVRLHRLIDDKTLRDKILKKLEEYPEKDRSHRLNDIISEAFN